MTSKHVFNDPEDLVLHSLRGAVILNPALRLHGATKTVYISREATTSSKARVCVISGGGAGHEPAHAGYVGIGMLRTAVSGEIFASPSASQVRTAIDLALAVSTRGPKEILLIVNNYTGDRLNFGLAAETARSKGIEVATVTVADDVAVGRTPLGLVGRRGLAGNILVCKILGAAAERGLPLKDVADLGNAVTENLASIGLSLDHCHVPGRGKKSGDWEKLEDEACELGLGLHNEKGVQRLNEIPNPREIVNMMLKPLLDNADQERSYVSFSRESNEDTVLFINNLGGLSQLEMGAVVEEIHKQLATMNVHPSRVYSSSYMTSLNAPGFSISLLNISSAGRVWCSRSTPNATLISITELLDDPTDALAWIGVRQHWPCRGQRDFPRDLAGEELRTEELVQALRAEVPSSQLKQNKNDDPDLVEAILQGAAHAVLEVEAELTRFDTICGDGDCGTTFSAGATAVLDSINSSTINLENAPDTALELARLFEGSMGGTSGALFCLFFTSLSASLQASSWRDASLQALEALTAYTPARPGDRTLVDSLEPFCITLQGGKPLAEAAAAALQGAERTRGMTPKLGRAVYLGGESNDVPDPGAWGVMSIAQGIARAFDRYGSGL